MAALAGQVMVLTGASSGIGRATALALARERATVHLIARSADELEQVCEEARTLGGHAEAHAFDITDPGCFERLAQAIGDVDVLINNAGVGVTKGFLETTDDDWSWTFDTNLHSMVSAVRAFLPGMLERGTGTVVNVSSIVALTGSALPAYTASKAAVFGLTESLEVEYGPRGIKFVLVLPGPTNTGIAQASVRAGRHASELSSMMQETLEKHGAAPETVARDIVRAIQRPRFLVLTPPMAAFMRTVHRLLPGISRSLTRKMSYPS